MIAGVRHLLLALAPEAQAGRALFIAVSVIRARLVGLELYHRAELMKVLNSCQLCASQCSPAATNPSKGPLLT